MSNRLFLLDGHSLAHRAFYALPLLSNSEGHYTNAVFGFCKMLFRLIDDEDPDLMGVAFDKKGPTFRHKEYDEYKADRKETPEELSPQFDILKKLLEVLKIPQFEVDGFEADDIIGTLAKRAADDGYQVVIVTGDRDALQLVDENIKVMYTRKGITDIVYYDLKKVREKYQLEPKQLVDMKGLMGDKSDNIPGIPGIGEKTATSLLKEFSSMENILDNIEKVSGKKRKENLRKYGEQARMSKMLGEIKVNVPLDIDYNQLKRGELTPEENKRVVELFEDLEFNSLLERYQEIDILSPEDVEIIDLKKSEQIKNSLSEIKEKGKMSVLFLLDEYDNPVESNLECILISYKENEVLRLPPEEKIFNIIEPLLENKNIKKVMYKAKETMLTAKRYNLEINGLVFEPLLARYLLYPSENMISIDELFKQELSFEPGDDLPRIKKYAIRINRLFELNDILMEKLENKNLIQVYKDIELPLIPCLAEMELNGIKVDRTYLNKLSEKWQQRINKIVKKAHKLAGEEFNLNSPQQVGEVLFEKLGLPVIKRTKTGYSTSISVLEKLKDKHEIVPLIMEYRKWSKLKSTYVDALPPLINSDTGRIHTSFNQMITATGRLSSTDPNLQNIPIRTKEGREVRKAFVPEDENWLLLAADYSQVELRVLAHISEDNSLQDAFQKGLDIHTETASRIFEVEPEQVTSNMRREAKVINFGIAYGMSAYGLSQDLDVSRKEAEEYIEKYFERFNGVKEYMDKVTEMAEDKGYVTTMFNRRRYIPDINSGNYHKRSFARRTAINTPIQGSAADIMKLAMIDVYDELSKNNLNARLLLQVHDELVLEVKKEDLKETAKLLKEKMEKTVSLNVPLEVDLQIASNWRDKKDYVVDENA
ncbi:MAG: DNA polymerase I [Halanaerobiales bacterium]